MGNCQNPERRKRVHKDLEVFYKDCLGYEISIRSRESDMGCVHVPLYYYDEKIIIFKSRELINLMKMIDQVFFRNIDRKYDPEIVLDHMKKKLPKIIEWYDATLNTVKKQNGVENLSDIIDLKLDKDHLKLIIQLTHLIKDLNEYFYPMKATKDV